MNTAEANVFQRYRPDARRTVGMLRQASAWTAENDSRAVVKVNRQGVGDPGYRSMSAWLNNYGNDIDLCGRAAVGVSLIGSRGKPNGEKVHHGRCRKRVCPICNAIGNAGVAASLRELIRNRLEAGARLYFFTLTVKHTKADSLKSTRRALDKAWALFIRRKLFRDTWAERHRVAEVEYTKDNGFHPHFHGLAELDPSSAAAYWRNDKLESEMKDLWGACTAKQGRPSWSVDFRAVNIHARCKETGDISHVRYWVRPKELPKLLRAEKRGKVTLWRSKGQVYRVQMMASFIDELTKYITKRRADGVKPNQVPFFDWRPEMVREYVVGIRGWNMHRSSKGWAQLTAAFEEALDVRREIEEAEAGGADFHSWAKIAKDCEAAATRKLTRQEADAFALKYPRILAALEREGCDVSAGQIRGHIFRFFGDLAEPLRQIQVTPWQRRAEHRDRADKARRDAKPKSTKRLWANEARNAILEGA